MRIGAIEDRFEADLTIGRAGELVAELEELIATYPFRERLRAFLMLALYRTGRQAEALDAYRGARAALVEELGLEPGPMLRDLEAAILRQDPALEPPPSSPPADRSDRASRSWLPRERRTVTVAVVDVAPRAEPDVDPEAVGRVGDRAARAAVDVLQGHGARVERLFGDTVMAFFGFPRAREDDTLRAVRAALEVRTAVHGLDDDPSHVHGVGNRVRIGVETGDIVVAGPGAAAHDVVTGPVVGTAGRLQQGAADGDVTVGPAAAKILRGTAILMPVGSDAGERAIATAWRVLELVAGAPAVPRALGAPMFGRESELTRLRSAFRRATRSGAVVRTTVLGEAGIGKSRLAKEMVASIGPDVGPITLRCPAEGERTFFPLREAVVEAAGLRGWRELHDLLEEGERGERALGQIADAMGLRAEPENASVLLPATRRLFEALAAKHPLIVTFEDLHWAEPTVLDLVDHLADEATGPILLLCLARPELVELRPDWEEQDRLQLEPLASEDLERLAVERAGSIAPDALDRIVDVSQGNPLFAEQLLAALEDDADEVPGSLRGLLTMRLDRLGPGERDVLRFGSIAGMDVPLDAVLALLPDDARPFVDRHVDTLERKRLIERGDPDGFRFCHALIRLSAYQSMTREDRARLHERFAGWLEDGSRDQPPELDEILGHHLTQADRHRRAAGSPS